MKPESGVVKGKPGMFLALSPVLVMLASLSISLLFVELSSELIVVVMLLAAATAGVVGTQYGVSWADIQKAAGGKVAEVLPALLILLSIGMLIALWVVSGTIPFLVYWGVRLVSPEHLVVTAFLATVLMSSFTGTSWGSAGTIGVAMMGTAMALGAPLPMVAGAVISGAYFGDKMSPISDSTILASVSADVDLYVHIRHLLYTAGPSFLLSLVVYAWAGRLAFEPGSGIPESGLQMLRDIDAVFSLGWYTLIPPLIVLGCILKKVPAAIAIVLSSLSAGLIGKFAQGFTLQDIVLSTVSGFKLTMVASTGADMTTLSNAFRILAERGGLYSMSSTLVLVFAAFLLAGAMEASGALDVIIRRFLGMVKSVFALIVATMASGLMLIGLTSHGGVTMLVIGGLFRQPYKDMGLAPENLSRSLEDSITITEVLMPWTVSAVFMATTLGVPTLSYAPWAIFCWMGPILSLAIAGLYKLTGYGITRISGDQLASHVSE